MRLLVEAATLTTVSEASLRNSLVAIVEETSSFEKLLEEARKMKVETDGLELTI